LDLQLLLLFFFDFIISFLYSLYSLYLGQSFLSNQYIKSNKINSLESKKEKEKKKKKKKKLKR